MHRFGDTKSLLRCHIRQIVLRGLIYWLPALLRLVTEYWCQQILVICSPSTYLIVQKRRLFILQQISNRCGTFTIACFGFYAVTAIFQPCNGGDDRLWNFEVSLAAITSLHFYKIKRNCLLRAKGVVILDTGHQLTSHPTDFSTTYESHMIIIWIVSYENHKKMHHRWIICRESYVILIWKATHLRICGNIACIRRQRIDWDYQSLIQSYRCLPLSISVNVSILQDSCKISVYSIICV